MKTTSTTPSQTVSRCNASQGNGLRRRATVSNIIAGEQLHLFAHARPAPRASVAAVMDMEPLSRLTDPTSSYLAADRIRLTGVAGKQRRAVFQALRTNPGRTSAELARVMGGDRYVASRRLPELRSAGWVRNGEPRRCSISGIVCETWYPVNQ